MRPGSAPIEILDLTPIPFYNADVEALGLPEPVVELRERIADADALLLTVPEYNHSYTAVLKNARRNVPVGGGTVTAATRLMPKQ